MSRTKSTGLIKAAVRPKSDAGHAGWRPKVDMAASMQINGVRPAAVPVEPPDLESDIEAGRVLDLGAVVRMRAAERAAESARQRPPNPIEYPPPVEAEAASVAPSSPEPRRMTQPGLFDALGVKV